MAPVYVSYTQRDERRAKPQDPGTPTNAEPTTRKWLKYYLKDEAGNEVLAATGEDQGDAHYRYHNAPDFTQYGTVSFHNRKELVVWLDGIIRQSQGLPPAVGRTGELRAPGTPGSDGSPRKIVPTPMAMSATPLFPIYISYRQEKFHHDDGRRAVRFYLVDKDGGSALAVSGDERDNKDGHYIYRTEITLPGIDKPSKGFNNMADINRWLEAVVQSCGGTVPVTAEMLAPSASPKLKGRLQNKRALDTGATPSGRLMPRLGGAAEAAHARRLKALREDVDPVTKAANDSYMQSLNHAAKAAASKRQAAVKSVQLYLKGVLPKKVQESLAEHKATLKAAADRCNPVKPMTKREAKIAPPLPPVGTVLEALREVGGLFLPISEICNGGLVDSVQRVQAHPEAAIKDLAGNILGKWRAELAKQLGVLLDPAVLVDPSIRLEAIIKSIPPPPPRQLSVKTPRTGLPGALALPSPAGMTPLVGSAVQATPGGGPTPASVFKVPPPKFSDSATPSATPVGMAAAPPAASMASSIATAGGAQAGQAPLPLGQEASQKAQTTGDKRLPAAQKAAGVPGSGTFADKTLPPAMQRQGGAGGGTQTGDKTLPGGNKPAFGDKRRPSAAAAEVDEEDDGDDMDEEDDDDVGGIGSPIGFGDFNNMED